MTRSIGKAKMERGPYGLYSGRDGRTDLARERLRRGLTQVEAAELLGCDRSQLAGYESGARRLPRNRFRNRTLLDRIAVYLAGGALVVGVPVEIGRNVAGDR